MRRLPIYGLDIETDTRVDGLDPAVSRIVAVALSTEGADELFDGPEDDLLGALDDRLAELPAGVVATWNGSAFDLREFHDQVLGHGSLPLATLARELPNWVSTPA